MDLETCRQRISIKLLEGKLLIGYLPGKRYHSMALTTQFRRLNIVFTTVKIREKTGMHRFQC